MTESPTPAERAAIREGYSSLIRAKSPTSHIVETVIFALSEVGSLVTPGGAFELERLRLLMKAQPAALTEEQIEALVDAGDRVVNDATHEDMCACDGWPTECRYFRDGQWDMGGLAVAIPAIVGLWEVMRAAAVPVGELPEALHASSGAVIETRPVAAREELNDSPLHHAYRIPRDLPEVRS